MAFPKHGRIVCRLNAIMNARGISTTTLARQSGLSRQTVTLWRDGAPESFSGRALARLCYTLGLEPSSILVYLDRHTYLAARDNPEHPWHIYAAQR